MNPVLFVICSFIWGTTWLAIKYQLGTVDPMLSIAYRFCLASAALFVYCLATKRRLKFSLQDHFYIAVSGAFMFCLNYVCVYFAENDLPSGLVAVTMTSLIFLNAVNNRIFLKSKIVVKTLVGGGIGMMGLYLIFHSEISAFSLAGKSGVALVLCILGAVSASLGNTAAQVCHRRSIPVLQMQCFAMMYGGILTACMALIRRVPISFEATTGYVFSLLYLAAFGSVAAFLSYLTLLKNIGSDKAAYVTLVSPVVALIVSTMFEGYTWTPAALSGAVFIVAGNVVALRKKRSV